MILALASEEQSGEFTLQGLVNLAWAFATVDHSTAELFSALAMTAERRLGDFNP